ncbi:transposase [Lacrimispora sp. BS-2]|uniref:Transposase n=1 Tax=Lacrimispora sp. BS-2 TaxID=3151850 RepID=A0AAU7PU54_9FIRM
MANTFTEEQLNECSKEMLVQLFLSMQEQMGQMNRNMELLIEQLSIANQKRFGRSSEKLDIDGQLSMNDCFNEAEVIAALGTDLEPEMEEVSPCTYKRRKQKGKREEDLKGIETVEVLHELDKDQLEQIFGKDGWKRLPDEVYKRLDFHPATFKVLEHHVAVYAGKNNETMVKAKRSYDLLRNSIVTPSLEAAIINSKYVNAIPLYRLEQEFARNEIHLSRQNMANWTIQCAERYLSLLWDRMHKEMCSCL